MDRPVDARGLTTIGDPTRARILRIIRESVEGRALVGTLAETLGLRQPTVSHHMKALLADGVVVREPDGRRAWYSIAPEHLERVDALLGDVDLATVAPDLTRITADLALRFRGLFSPETVAATVAESFGLLSQSGSSHALGSRTAAFAADRLTALGAAADRVAGSRPPTVLFVCVQNAGRSQLAGGILRQLAGDRVVVRTAGSTPAPEVRSTIATALEEIGVALGGEFPKPLTDDAVRAADVVVTMGCGDACPVYPGRRYLDWDLEDPVGKPLDRVRGIRDDIDARVRVLLAELEGESSPAVHIVA